MSDNEEAPIEEIEVEEEEVGVEAEPSEEEKPAVKKTVEKKTVEKKGAEKPAVEKVPEKGKEKEKKKAPKGAKAEEKEEKKKEEEEEEEEEDKVVEEKVITINLRHAYLAYSRKPTPRSVKLVKKITQKLFKTEEGIKIDEGLNAILWSRGKTKSQRRVSVKVQKLESGIVRVLPAEA